jgi:N6-L-threonylcarbamoyladenine synthase
LHNSNPCILAIETSCDDTSVAVLKDGNILANVTASQHIHSKYGGVVPELASRDHEKKLIQVYKEALSLAKIEQNQLNAIAFTQGPGLLGSLLVGTSFAKSLSLGLGIPLIAVNHLQAHVAALYINNPKPTFPFLCLLVSGGHTETLLVKDYFDFERLGTTQDDAAGEAFDKIGKMMGLPYPAGPHIDKLAQQGNPKAYEFTYSKVPGYNYSFSGLKTQVLYFLQKQVKENPNFVEQHLPDLCASVQHHICMYLAKPMLQILEKHSVKGIGLVGGVSANSELRKTLATLAQTHNLPFMVPDFEFCTDNAGMIAEVAKHKYAQQVFVGLDVVAKARF